MEDLSILVERMKDSYVNICTRGDTVEVYTYGGDTYIESEMCKRVKNLTKSLVDLYDILREVEYYNLGYKKTYQKVVDCDITNGVLSLVYNEYELVYESDFNSKGQYIIQALYDFSQTHTKKALDSFNKKVVESKCVYTPMNVLTHYLCFGIKTRSLLMPVLSPKLQIVSQSTIVTSNFKILNL